MNQVTLSISSAQLDEPDLQQLTNNLNRDVNRETDITATFPENSSEVGSKGEPITLGVISLAFLTTGTAVAIFNVIRAYFERDSSLKMEFEREDGKKMVIVAEKMNSSKIDKAMLLAEKFFGYKDE